MPLAQATRLLTGLIAWSRWVVPLDCSVTVGALVAWAASIDGAVEVAVEGSELSEQANVVAATMPAIRPALDRVRIMGVSDVRK